MTLTRIEPVIDPEDASAFSYHIALVKSKDDMLCVTTQPASAEVSHYVVWINKPSAVSDHKPLNPLPDMPILGSSNSAANKNMTSKI